MKTLLRITAACALAAATTTLAQEQAPAPATPPEAAAPAPAAELQTAAIAVQPAAPADATELQRPRYGFGISTALVPGASGRLDTQGLGIAFVLFRDRIRIEPELGFYVFDQDSATSPGVKLRFLSVGGGVLYELSRAERSAVYAGGRLSLSFAEQAFSGWSSGWSTGQSLSAVLGGEYFPAPFVSVGLEALASLTGSHPESGPDTYILSSRGLLVLRFYVP
jgi:hypothetical protein